MGFPKARHGLLKAPPTKSAFTLFLLPSSSLGTHPGRRRRRRRRDVVDEHRELINCANKKEAVVTAITRPSPHSGLMWLQLRQDTTRGEKEE